jgi:hypothetical protein
MTTGWAIVGTFYEYDDERYRESGLQAPTKVYLNRESALLAVMEETFSFIEREDIESFECGENFIVSEEGKKILQTYLPILEVHCETTLDLDHYSDVCVALKNIGSIISSEQREALFHNLHLRPYGLVEVFIES